ncbi:MAG: 6-bladed beta-propeller [Parabacteroides sp.]|nr:6-bladed beta-propeller [Parabacteroides sp.]
MCKDTLLQLPVIDLQKNYPEKYITLQDIADVEYIVLESHDDALISTPYTVITDSLIITYSFLEDNVIFFQRSGKFSHCFNRKGQSGEEYIKIGDIKVNTTTNEVYINDWQKHRIQVYNYNGDYIRTLKTMDSSGNGSNMGTIYNYGENHLLFEDRWKVDQEDDSKANKQPYYCISTLDGTMKRLPLFIPKRIRDGYNWYDEETDEFGSMGINFSPAAYISDELIISDFGLDTVYSYKENRLTPIAVRKNRMKSEKVPIIAALEAISDKYFLWYAVEKDIKKTIWPDWTYLQDRRTGRCIEIRLVDKNITDKKFRFRSRPSANGYTVPKHHFMQYYPAYKLIELLEADKLQGELKEIASKLKEDDNPVIMLAKFK